MFDHPDLVGYADIVGDGSVAGTPQPAMYTPYHAAVAAGLKGQGRAMPVNYHPALMSALAQQPLIATSPHGGAYQGRMQHVTRRQISPLPRTSVLKNTTAIATVLPQRAIRVQRLVLQSDTSPTVLTVNNITVGARPQFVNAGNVPIGVFASNAFDVELRGDTASPGISITVEFENPAATADEVVSGAIIGEALDVA